MKFASRGPHALAGALPVGASALTRLLQRFSSASIAMLRGHGLALAMGTGLALVSALAEGCAGPAGMGSMRQSSLAPPAGAHSGPGPAPIVAAADPAALLADRDPALAVNKRLVFDMWRHIVNAGQVERADAMLAPGYIQHSPVISTGREAFKAVFGTVPRKAAPETVSPPLVTIIAEGDLVIMALREELPAGPGMGTYTTTHFNMFRVAGGRLAEHWHSVGTPPGPAIPAPDGGGPQLVTGLEGASQALLLGASDAALAANKRLVYEALLVLFDAGQEADVSRLVAPDYIEHDPNLDSGSAALVARLAARPARPLADHLKAPLVALVAQGDLVVAVTARTHPHPSRRGAIYTTTGFDMFRISGKRLAEHWSGEALTGAPTPSYGG